VRAYADNESRRALSPGDFIGKWINIMKPALEQIGTRPVDEQLDAYAERLAFANISQALENLKTFPCISTLVERGKLQLHGCYFDVFSGALRVRDSKTGEFSAVFSEVSPMQLDWKTTSFSNTVESKTSGACSADDSAKSGARALAVAAASGKASVVNTDSFSFRFICVAAVAAVAVAFLRRNN
jgi:hypothetical protein